MKVATIPPVLLTYWPEMDQFEQALSLGSAGGLSGSEIWRITNSLGQFCLKRWPGEGTTVGRLNWIHSQLRHVAAQGLRFVPAPIQTRAGQTCVELGGSFWELAPWLQGDPLQTIPTPAQIQSALSRLAQFHLAVVDAPSNTADRLRPSGELTSGPSPTAASRREWLAELLGAGPGSATTLLQAAEMSSWPELRQRMVEIREHFPSCAAAAWEQIQTAAETQVALQPVIRDVWRDNLLFTGDDLTGLVDYGAMRIDSVACDLSRILGSLAPDDPRLWQAGLNAYRALRPLNQSEVHLIYALDAAAVALTCLQWAKWLCLEGRQFADPGKVLSRIDFNLGRMRSLGKSSAAGPNRIWPDPADSVLG